MNIEEVMNSTRRGIFSQRDLEFFWKSKAHDDLVQFVKDLAESAQDCSLSAPCTISPICQKILDMLDKISLWVDEIPPLQQPMRYGNKAFRILYDRLSENSVAIVDNILPPESKKFAHEFASYIMDSFGNSTRIDYGTGHECTFIVFLLCLKLVGAIDKDDYKCLILKIFHRYIFTVRKIQTTYWLEPAGSHGVWSLDDYQMLVFYFGAAQLLNNLEIQPSDVCKADLLATYENDYLYFHAIAFIMKVKTGSFKIHSPMLYDVSQLKTWERVMKGMYRMFDGEVLQKLPVIQHFRFGSIFKCEWEPSADPNNREYARLTQKE